MKPKTEHALISALKGLPLIRFALMLGGGFIASLAVMHVQVWLAYESTFPHSDAIWLARIQGMTWLGMGSISVIIIVMITLAWGKVGRVSGTFGATTIEASFDDDDEPEKEK
jgi:hypothetical protein